MLQIAQNHITAGRAAEQVTPPMAWRRASTEPKHSKAGLWGQAPRSRVLCDCEQKTQTLFNASERAHDRNEI